jgi:Xaa-Pro dipeptidase
MYMEPRVRRIFSNIEEHEERVPDVVVLINGTDPLLDMTFYYATRLETGLFEGSVAVLQPDGNLDVITSLLEAESASKGGFDLHVFKTLDELKDLLADLVKGAGSIGINGAELTYKNYFLVKDLAPKADIMDVAKPITRTRMVKDSDEVTVLRKACRIASDVAGEMTGFIKEGVIEYEVAAEMCYRMQKKGAIGPAFDTIVAFGKNSAEPHYHAGESVLKKGEFVLLDFGALYKRYRSDITRTYFCGKPSVKQREMYEVVAEAQRCAMEVIQVGEKASEPHSAVADYIDSTKFKGLFTHGLGHSIGLATHDGGGLNPRAGDIVLEEGMVFTVEPGVYEPGFGGVRIEDDVVVRKGGPEVLTTASRDVFAL